MGTEGWLKGLQRIALDNALREVISECRSIRIEGFLAQIQTTERRKGEQIFKYLFKYHKSSLSLFIFLFCFISFVFSWCEFPDKCIFDVDFKLFLVVKHKHTLRSISYNMRRYSLNLHWNQNVLTYVKNKTQTVCRWCRNLCHQIWNFYVERLEQLSYLIIDMGDETGWMGCNCNRVYVSVHPHLLIGNKSVVFLRGWRGFFD